MHDCVATGECKSNSNLHFPLQNLQDAVDSDSGAWVGTILESFGICIRTAGKYCILSFWEMYGTQPLPQLVNTNDDLKNSKFKMSFE